MHHSVRQLVSLTIRLIDILKVTYRQRQRAPFLGTPTLFQLDVDLNCFLSFLDNLHTQRNATLTRINNHNTGTCEAARHKAKPIPFSLLGTFKIYNSLHVRVKATLFLLGIANTSQKLNFNFYGNN